MQCKWPQAWWPISSELLLYKYTHSSQSNSQSNSQQYWRQDQRLKAYSCFVIWMSFYYIMTNWVAGLTSHSVTPTQLTHYYSQCHLARWLIHHKFRLGWVIHIRYWNRNNLSTHYSVYSFTFPVPVLQMCQAGCSRHSIYTVMVSELA